jgi:hypothetical protein
VRIFLLRERFVAPPAAAATNIDASTTQPLSDMFNFAGALTLTLLTLALTLAL